MATFKVLIRSRWGTWNVYSMTPEEIKWFTLCGGLYTPMSITVLGPTDNFPPAADLGVLVFQSDYAAWASDASRARRPGHTEDYEHDFGTGCWQLAQQPYPRYRVSWNSRTGELYACELDPHDPCDRFAVLAVFPTFEEAKAAMEDWAESDHDLLFLVSRLAGLRPLSSA